MPFGIIHHAGPNIGDDIQTLAAMQFLPRVDYIIDRENTAGANVPSGTKAIFNGWYLHNTCQWPPSERILPLFVSFHTVAPNAANFIEWICNHALGTATQDLVDARLANYYRHFAPIGCRDIATQKRFEAIGIKATFSGCLTLTLTPPTGARNDAVIFSDPFGTLPGNCFRPDLWWKLPQRLRKNAIKTSHLTRLKSFDTRMNRAHDLFSLYAGARLVVTSRLHAALVCVAFGTPVIMLNVNHRTERFLGYERIIQPVPVVRFMEEARSGDIMSLVSHTDTQFVRTLTNALKKRCRDFIAQ